MCQTQSILQDLLFNCTENVHSYYFWMLNLSKLEYIFNNIYIVKQRTLRTILLLLMAQGYHYEHGLLCPIV